VRSVLNPQEEYSSTTNDLSPLFQPITIGSLTLKNRIVKSPSGSDTWETPDGDNLTENYLNYYENFAKGGAALVFTESAISKYNTANVAERTRGGWFGGRLEMAAQLMGPVVERIHKHGAYVGCQIGAAGGVDFSEATLDDIHWMQEHILNLTKAYQSAGYDIVQLHCSAQQVLNLIMTPRGNKRTDSYGANTIENRTRFTCEVIKMIKQECGKDFPIQILMNATEENDQVTGDNDGFIQLTHCIENAKAFETAGADTIYLRINVPGLHISQFAPDLQFSGYKCEGLTGFGTMFDYSQHFGGALNGQWSGCALILKAAAEFKKHLGIPVSCAGYMDPRTSPDIISNAITNGEIDYLMMTRPLTVDPEYPNKLQAGKRDEIAPCCRCMHCHNKGAPSGSGDEWCRVNARTQNAYSSWNNMTRAEKLSQIIFGKAVKTDRELMPEGYDLLPATTPKNIIVVGAGPAGMEAARIAAQRGHSVTLYEKDASLGGLLKTASPYKGDHERLDDLIAYLSRQQEVNEVNVVTGIEVDADLIKTENPDAVIIATGGKRASKFSSAGSTAVIPFDELISSEIGEQVIICGAGAQAVDLALYLLADGKKIQMVHDGLRADIAKEHSMWHGTYIKPHLYAQGVKIWSSTKIVGVVEGGMEIVDQQGTPITLPCDTVIEVYDMVPNTALYDSIKGDFETYAIGDCIAPWNIADAITAGNLAARRL
jgi:2,4-dienoyl-CoA reductase-like NADH-dependent reductase (Old Yellow Enzyme family)/thioredoxin reductase